MPHTAAWKRGSSAANAGCFSAASAKFSNFSLTR